MNVVAHGGAGSAPEEPVTRREVLPRAASDAGDLVNPLETACSAVRALEQYPQFNPGVGIFARVVARETPHVLLTGDPAVELASEFDVEPK